MFSSRRFLLLISWLLGSHGLVLGQPPGAVTYHFVITQLPENTPHDAQLFLAGNFTRWNSAHPAYRFQRSDEGIYQLTIRSALPRLEYKITRGDWTSVEGRESGKARMNHTLIRPTGTASVEVDVAVLSWEDFSGTFHFYSIYDLLMLFAAFQGVLLLIAIPGIQNYNRSANRWLLFLLALTSALIFIRTVSTYRDVAQTYTRLLLASDLIFFLYAPLFYIYLRTLLFSTARPPAGWWPHFMPAVVQVIVYMPFLLGNSKQLQLDFVNRAPWLLGVMLTAGLVGLFYNAGYWLLCRRAIRTYQAQHQLRLSTEPQVNYLTTVLTVQAVCLVLWAFFFVLVGIGSFFSMGDIAVAEKSADLIWLTFSSLTYLLGYYAIHQPEVFKLPDTEEEEALSALTPLPPTYPANEARAAVAPRLVGPAPAEVAHSDMSTESLFIEPTGVLEVTHRLRDQIDTYLNQHKPYTNPDLTLADLALQLGLPPHTLSKVLNESYQKNFFDFVNAHRVHELTSRLNDPSFRSHTLLSMAFEVGFNSKTAFNRAFKKLMNQTPTDYLADHKGERAKA